MTIAEDFHFLITAAVAQWHDMEWLKKHLPANAPFTLEDVTEGFSCQILTGPKSRAILAATSDGDLRVALADASDREDCRPALPVCARFLRRRTGLGNPQQGADTPAIFDAVWAEGQKHGLKPFGMFALDSLRIEKELPRLEGRPFH